MKPTVLVALVGLLAWLAVAARATLPGVRVDISETGINHIVEVVLPILEKELLDAKIPDITGDAHTPIGKIAYTLSKIQLVKFSLKDAKIALGAPASIGLSISGLTAELKLHWHYREHNWPHISDSGTADATATNARAVVTIAVSWDPASGHPTAHVTACSLDIGKLTIKLHGGASWLYTIFEHIFHSQIVKAIDSGVCTEIRAEGNAILAKMLASMPIKEPIGAGMGIDYALVAAPSHLANPSRLSVPVLGEIYALSEGPGHTPFDPIELPMSTTDKWFEAIISQWTFDSVAYAAWRAGALSLRLTKEMAPAAAAAFFSTSFYKPYAPGLWNLYGKTDVALSISVDAMPGFSVDTTGFFAVFPVTITIFPKNATSGEYSEAFAVLATTFCEGEFEINTTSSIVGEITVLNATTSLVETYVGEISIDGMNDLVAFALAMGQDLVNGYLDTGFPLPSINGIYITDSTIKWYKGYIATAGNFKYVAPAELAIAAHEAHELLVAGML